MMPLAVTVAAQVYGICHVYLYCFARFTIAAACRLLIDLRQPRRARHASIDVCRDELYEPSCYATYLRLPPPSIA